LIFDKGGKTVRWRKDHPFNKGLRNNWTFTGRSSTLDTDLTLLIKINSKWIIDLNVKCKTIKLLEENIGENLGNLWLGNDSFDKNTTSTICEKIIDELDFIKIKNFC